MNKNIVFVVNRATDISLAQILFKTKPENINLKIASTVFYYNRNEFNWKKSKSLVKDLI